MADVIYVALVAVLYLVGWATAYRLGAKDERRRHSDGDENV